MLTRALPSSLFLFALANPALADPQALSTNVPVQTQDALAVRAGVMELQGVGVYNKG